MRSQIKQIIYNGKGRKGFTKDFHRKRDEKFHSMQDIKDGKAIGLVEKDILC